jgi:hypothetical protein
MNVDISCILPCTLEQAVSQVQTTRLLRHISSPLVVFSTLTGDPFPEKWTMGTHWVRLTLLGVIPFGTQAIVLSSPPVSSGFALRDAGYGRLIAVWDHLITIEPAMDGVRYRDRVTVRAGLLTPMVWLFAQLFYRHRQRRWRRLAANNFDYAVL